MLEGPDILEQTSDDDTGIRLTGRAMDNCNVLLVKIIPALHGVTQREDCAQ